MAWVGFPEEGFAWNGPGGEPQWFATYPARDTHPAIERGFCPRCGASVASRGDEAGFVGVTIMALDDHSGLVPEHQSFKDNAVPWLPPLS